MNIEKNMGKRIEVGIRKECVEICHIEQLQDSLSDLCKDIFKEYEEVDKHYKNTSLFLESLLRRDHFEKGHIVLRRKMCRFRKEVLDPQLERYKQRLERRGISIDYHLGEMPDEDIPLAVDVGLISQVYANLFSNAEKAVIRRSNSLIISNFRSLRSKTVRMLSKPSMASRFCNSVLPFNARSTRANKNSSLRNVRMRSLSGCS